MKQSRYVKLVIFVPTSHAKRMRAALGEAGAGKIGNYSYCTFSTKGMGRFFPHPGSRPMVGVVGELKSVDEERIETLCERIKLRATIKAMRAAHPYEVPAFDVYSLENTL